MKHQRINKPEHPQVRIIKCYSQLDVYLELLCEFEDEDNYCVIEYDIETQENQMTIKVKTRFLDFLKSIQETIEEIGDEHFAELRALNIAYSDDTINFQGIYVLQF